MGTGELYAYPRGRGGNGSRHRQYQSLFFGNFSACVRCARPRRNMLQVCETLLLADVLDSRTNWRTLGLNSASGDTTITTSDYCSPPRTKPYKEEKRVVLEQPGITFAILGLKLQQNIPDN